MRVERRCLERFAMFLGISRGAFEAERRSSFFSFRPANSIVDELDCLLLLAGVWLADGCI